MVNQRLGAFLQHRPQLGAARQSEANLGRERRVVLGLLARAHFLLERGPAHRRFLHLDDAALAGDQEEDVLEDDPRRVLQPSPLAGDQHAVDRLGPEHAAQHVIERDDDRGGQQHAPVAVKREKCQRPEDVKVRFEAAAGQVNQERAHEHLRHGDRVARRCFARAQQAEQRREETNPAAEKDGGPDVDVRAADRAVPRERRHPEGEDNAGDPLEHHQAREELIRPPVDFVLMPGEQIVGPTADRSRSFRELKQRHVISCLKSADRPWRRGNSQRRRRGDDRHGLE